MKRSPLRQGPLIKALLINFIFPAPLASKRCTWCSERRFQPCSGVFVAPPEVATGPGGCGIALGPRPHLTATRNAPVLVTHVLMRWASVSSHQSHAEAGINSACEPQSLQRAARGVLHLQCPNSGFCVGSGLGFLTGLGFFPTRTAEVQILRCSPRACYLYSLFFFSPRCRAHVSERNH